MKLVVGRQAAKPLNLKNGARLRLEVTRNSGAAQSGFLLRVYVLMSDGQRWRSVDLDSLECDGEIALWTTVSTFAQDRLCDLADAEEMERGGP